MRGAASTAVFLASLGMASCGGGGDEAPGTGSLAREAAGVIAQLERSIAAGDFERVCADLLSAEVRRQAGGGDCPAQLARTSRGIERPNIEVDKIQIQGAVAVVDVVTTAEGQARVEDKIRLVREAGGYRISSLSG